MRIFMKEFPYTMRFKLYALRYALCELFGGEPCLKTI